MNTVMRLGRLGWPHRRGIAAAAFLAVLATGSAIALAATSAYLIAKAAVVTDVAALAIAFTSVRLFAITRGCFRYLERLTTHATTFAISTDLRGWFYESVEPLAPAALSQHHTGDLLDRSVADVETLEGLYARVLVGPASALAAAAGASVFLASFDVMLGLTVFGLICIAAIAVPMGVRVLTTAPSREVVEARSELHALLVDQVQGAAELRVFDTAGRSLEGVENASGRGGRAQEIVASVDGLGAGITAALGTAAALAAIAIAAPAIRGGSLPVVDLALLALVAVAAFEAIQPLPEVFGRMEEGVAAGRRLFGILDAQRAVSDPAKPARMPDVYDIDFRHVGFSYGAGEAEVLNDASFSIRQGERLAISGANGAGKSTIVNLLLRFWDYETGSIAIGGREIRTLRGEDVRAAIGVMAQSVHLFNGTVRDNLYLAAPAATDDDIEDACRRAQLHDFVASLPQGYDTPIGENGMLLSGGERQRLALARLILKDSPILLLDEPTANLDAATEERLLEALGPFMAGRTVLLVSHRPAVLACADRRLRLEGGRLHV
ncbi:MAG TPA: thiol reductant ABC exporter subunit CydC [Dehalococcoidia bacterium]